MNSTPISRPDELRRSDRRSLEMQVRADGTLLVRAPRDMPQEAIDYYLQKNAGWIVKKQEIYRHRHLTDAPQVKEGEVWPFYGHTLTLHLYDGNACTVDLARGDVFLPRDNAVQVWEQWLREQTRCICGELAAEWEKRISVQAGIIKVNGARHRWGSCSARGSLNFSWHLVLCPPEVVEYVVIHELCHRRYMNHSAAYWRLVAQHCPLYDTHRRWLAAHNAIMRAGEEKNEKK